MYILKVKKLLEKKEVAYSISIMEVKKGSGKRI